ncbi:MAG: 1-acyl-sn-glycerol-3-phosphate acyltransferase [Bacteroidaceae bacterium]|nr:1-acyl-sn-glycerol-3-phosphate acyltransferase [Bacteroidaceae bacterium]
MLYKTYTFLIATPLFILMSAFCGSLTALAGICGDRRYFAHYVPQFWSWFTCTIYLLPITVVGREKLDPKQTYVFMPNHQGYFDIFLVYAYLGHKFKWMMKDYLRNIPFIGYACYKSGHVYIGESVSSIAKAVEESRENLEKGMSMCIFPEGTRTHDGNVAEFKRGAFLLATQLKRPIVPITINGSYEVFNREATIVHHHAMELVIHDPIPYESFEGKSSKVLIKEVRDIVVSSLKRDPNPIEEE